MASWLQGFLFQRGLAPHGYCLLWDPWLIWTHVLADAMIAAAYFSIPLVLWRLIRRRPEIEFGWMLWLFALFILACGATHVLGILVLWQPFYGLQAAVKAITAVVSIATAVALWPLLPKLLAVPSPARLQATLDQLKAETEERERAEEMLRQSQKLQAVGQLTAGIAHDFNNLLTVITGNLDRASRMVRDEPTIARSLDNARTASERAATLTHQLLAFARKQPLMVEPADINGVVTGLQALLERTVGAHIAVKTDLASSLPLVTVDRNQLENALLNIALNARDAMPGGGELVLATSFGDNREVVVCVRDTGSGMDADTLARATEPFFTTKAVGSGSGLGLSQVYGFVTQTGGRLEIDSTVGTGTTVRIYLPVTGENA